METLSQLKHWLSEKRDFRTAWFDKGAKSKPQPEEALVELPESVSRELLSAVNNLPTHPHEQEVILEAVKDAIIRWREHPQRVNASTVVLAHPVSSVARILSDCLTKEATNSLEGKLAEQWPDQISPTIKVLDWIERPPKVGEIKKMIKEELGWQEEDFSEVEESRNNRELKENSDQQMVLAVIPNLCWCFLRSADGLDGIDYLQEMLLENSHQFWIIGSGEVGWEYLDSTLRLGAYCGPTVDTPTLNGEQLATWLSPIVEQFDICFGNFSLQERLQHSKSILNADLSLNSLDNVRSELSQQVNATLQSSLRTIKEEINGEDYKEEEDENPKRNYFDRLATISEGVAIVALQLFIKSLRYKKIEEVEDQSSAADNRSQAHSQTEANGQNNGSQNRDSQNRDSQSTDSQDSSDRKKPQILATLPKLPPLPELDQNDLYMLYSLMLHGDLTIKALAASLGDAPQVVNNQIQVLRNKQVVEQKDGIVKINPIYYPQLRRELARNNFVIEVS